MPLGNPSPVSMPGLRGVAEADLSALRGPNLAVWVVGGPGTRREVAPGTAPAQSLRHMDHSAGAAPRPGLHLDGVCLGGLATGEAPWSPPGGHQRLGQRGRDSVEGTSSTDSRCHRRGRAPAARWDGRTESAQPFGGSLSWACAPIPTAPRKPSGRDASDAQPPQKAPPCPPSLTGGAVAPTNRSYADATPGSRAHANSAPCHPGVGAPGWRGPSGTCVSCKPSSGGRRNCPGSIS